jgi:hypothetical protein
MANGRRAADDRARKKDKNKENRQIYIPSPEKHPMFLAYFTIAVAFH